MKTANQIRYEFIEFFKSKNHTHVPSAPVVPHGDPTLLFTNAGMNQFKDVFLGTGTRDYSRAVDTQKCIRVSGKHNDLEEVGVDTYHHTFFEMLGNWSFGDFYKKETIAWAWELLTEVWGLEKDRLFASVFRTDDEAFEIWKNYLPEDRILRFDEKDNFWEMGETGPCGPCSEIHYDGTPDKSGRDLVNADHPDVIEVWNLVFIQSNRKADGTIEDLPQKHVDTGMGLERIVRVLQGKSSNYDTDIFMPLINIIAKLSGRKYEGSLSDKDSIAMRVMADHVRTVAFSIADGAMPGNEGRGYVLRRVLRRASRFARNIGLTEPCLYKLVDVLVENMSSTFPEIKQQEGMIKKIIKGEEESFLKTLENGLTKFEEIKSKLDTEKIISGDDAFLLFDSFGFPLDLTQLIARENRLSVDESRFNELMKEQKQRSRASRKVTTQDVETLNIDAKTEFTGYTENSNFATILYIDGNQVVLEKSPFYTEKGGQIADIGHLKINQDKYEIIDVKQNSDAIIHITDRDINASVGDQVSLSIDYERRKAIMRNHSATHLMHEALRRVLGDHIQQQGSLVTNEYLRFDFNHFEKVSPKQIQEIEDLVNQKIYHYIDVNTQEISIEEAQDNPKIRMFFGDKYGSRVTSVTMDGEYSIELCGGTHVSNTSEIGFFKITSESSIASGIRRIEAITGLELRKYINKLDSKLKNKENQKTELKDKIKQLEKEISTLKTQQASDSFDDLTSNAKQINGIKVAIAQVEAEDMDQLRDMGENLRNTLKSNGIGLLATIVGEKIQLVCVVTDDIKNKYPAGKLVGLAAKTLGGGGGGKPHLATAGGRDLSKLPDLIQTEFYSIIENY